MSATALANLNVAQEGGTIESEVPIYDRIQPNYYELELERVFRRSWLLIGHVDDLAPSNGYFVVDVPTFSASIIVTRDREGTIRAFHNVCRHRGNKLVQTQCGFARGKAGLFTCGFHGWSFRNDGRLMGVPEEAMFQGLDKATHGLVELPVGTWGGLVFAYFGGKPDMTLKEWLGELYPGFDGYFDKMERIGTMTVDMACNWNLAIDSFSEGFHVVFLHRATTPSLIASREDGEDSMRPQPRIDLFKRHQRTAAAANTKRVSPPAEALLYRRGRRLTPDFDTDLGSLPEGVNPGRVEPWLFDDVKLLPNTGFINGAQWCTILQVWPEGAGRCRISLHAFASKARGAGDRLAQAYMRSLLFHVTLEDMLTMEPTDANIRSGVMRTMPLSLHEIAIQKRYGAIKDMIEENA